MPLWHSPVKRKPVYVAGNAQVSRDLPLYARHQKVRANRVDARIINLEIKQVITLEISCPWIANRAKKTEKNTLKYLPLRWKLKQRFQGYEVRQCNIITHVLGGWSRELEVVMKELVGRKGKDALHNMQKAVLSSSLNIARTFKVVT